ncbi:conserved hypothetical protein [Aspergillus terreus NIH2624]|uniref:Trafficking protein particle complex subunit n=1 Tax=Aspergillus terreus (strain NIH 2624 / FGSC A1156) TaxID=341663 RepID=Q0CWE0_ASPTN|nr:uncharacterized protein ATEG_01994 [Aspergillus terreus NIH2624]EAU36956.1 conserved hypothetical protein [Aspergillus terreus NIH2624]
MSHPARHSSMLSFSNSNSNLSSSSDKQQSSPQIPSAPQSSPGLRVPSNRKTIYDRHLNRSRNAESSRATDPPRLNEQGYPLGLRLLDLLFYRTMSSSSSSSLSGSSTSSSPPHRPLRILPLLHLIHGPLWRLLFNRPADALEHSVSPDTPNEYMITDNDPLVNTYISVPKEMSMLNCAAFVAGIIEGVCDGCGFEAKVTAHNQPTEMWPGRTIFLVRFGDSVMEREKVLERAGVK